MTETPNPLVVAHNAISMARAMRNLGRPQRAVAKYDEAIAALPEFIEALDECLAVLESIEDWQGVADRCATWVGLFPDHATHAEADRIHSRRVDALTRCGGLELALDAYGLMPVARTDAEVGSDEILAVIGLRDEFPRLPHVLDHHRRLGVDRFLIVDNGSTDGSLEYLADQPDTVVWRTDASYRAANCGAVWWDLLLRRHARGNWCLIIDADEYFIFPGWETRRLRDLCAELDVQRATCYPAIFLDMYGPGPLSTSVIGPESDLLATFPFFDRKWFRMRRPMAGPRRNLVNHWGGVRARIFGDRALDSYLLDKIPLFRHRTGDVLLSGNHWTSRPSAEIADGRGVLLHFKYDAGFAALIAREVERGEHAGGARAYRRIADELGTEADPQLFDPAYSVRYENSDQLLRFGIMRSDAVDADPPTARDLVIVPEIPAAAQVKGEAEPFWSVVMLAQHRGISTQIDAALVALAEEPASEIVLVVTADAPELPPELPTAGNHRIRVVSTPLHLTDLEAINLGLGAAQGGWVSVGSEAIEGADLDLGEVREVIEQTAPAVLVVSEVDVADPLDLPFDLAVTSLVIRRDCLGRHGGLATSIDGSAGWEYVQRVVGDDPSRFGALTVATLFRPDTGPAVTMEFGLDIAHRRLAIELVAERSQLDTTTLGALLDRCADDATERVIVDVERSRIGSALAVLVEILDAPLSEQSRRSVIESLSRRMR